MTNYKPILIMRNMMIFPSSEARIELVEKTDKDIIKIASNFYDNEILIVNLDDKLEQEPRLNELSNYGILGKIKMKIEFVSLEQPERINEINDNIIRAEKEREKIQYEKS